MLFLCFVLLFYPFSLSLSLPSRVPFVSPVRERFGAECTRHRAFVFVKAGGLPFLASSPFDFSIEEKQYGRSRERERNLAGKKGWKITPLLIDKRSVNYPYPDKKVSSTLVSMARIRRSISTSAYYLLRKRKKENGSFVGTGSWVYYTLKWKLLTLNYCQFIIWRCNSLL